MHRTVSCSISADVLASATIELQIAVAGPARMGEQLHVRLDGQALSWVEHVSEAAGRLHLLQVGAGRLEISYRCEVIGQSAPPVGSRLDSTVYLRPSRYAESDRLVALAAAEFGGLTRPAALVRAVAAWVGTRLSYVPGSSSGTDGAVDTLLAGSGVCRDYAHLVVALLRARDVPARVVAVYAPGLLPMDFHAVAEALVEGRWLAVDPTLLAPRQSLVRIASGRDAADTAFLASYGGDVRLTALQVGAVISGGLPRDDLFA